MYWSITGPENYSQIKQGLSADKDGSFDLVIKDGEYSINLVMIYDTKTYDATKTISF